MHEPLSLRIVNLGQSDLPQDDRSVGREGTSDLGSDACRLASMESYRGNLEAHLDEIIFDREGDEVVVGQRLRALPHAGLVCVPVVARFHDLGLELREDDLERLDGVLLWRMGRIECKHFARCWWETCNQ